MRPANLGRLLRTVRHLKVSQVLWRARYQLERRARTRGIVPPERLDVDARIAELVPAPRTTDSSLARPLERGEKTDWLLGERSVDRLATITLHYHSWAHDLALAGEIDKLEDVLSDWIVRCDVAQEGARELAWSSYAIATRLAAWIRVYPYIERIQAAFLESLWRQAAFLEQHLEWDLRGNHLIRDAVGLAWAGRFFRGEAPRRWLEKATELALSQAAEQVLPDGGHFERSPMYHVKVMEDVLALALLLEGARSELRDTWVRMAEFLAWVRHPDGEIPLLNDAALHSALAPAEALERGSALGVTTDRAPRTGGKYFADSGLLVWHGPRWSVLFDVGPVGPDYQPGHGHADTLTFECSLDGKRLVVDPGTHDYDRSGVRAYDRATASHNTVCVDGQDSSEVWDIFRVGRRARPSGVSVNLSLDRCDFSGSHDGYMHLSGRPRHERRLSVSNDGPLAIVDTLHGGGHHRATGGLLLAPSWTAKAASGGWDLYFEGEKQAAVAVLGPAGLRLAAETRDYHPEFGVSVTATRLTWELEGPLPATIQTRISKAHA